jgi:hypothetical protein
MKNYIKPLYIGIFIVFFIACSDDKTDFIDHGSLTGRVVEANSFDPIENAKVTLSPTNNSVFTDAEGYFTFDEVLVGDYSVKAQKEGYLAGNEPISVLADANANIIFELELSDALNKPPLAPEIISPIDNSINLPLQVELVWHKSLDPDEDALVYGILIRNDYDESSLVVENLTDTTYTVSGLKHGVKYFWQISVDDSFNELVLSEIYTFETTSFPNNRFLYVQKANENQVIFSANETNEFITLTGNNQNCWRPRKNIVTQRIAFLKNVGSYTHIFTMKPDGTDVHQVTSQIPLVGFRQDEIDFAWSANGDRIMYTSFDKLYIINKDGSGNQLIYQTFDGSFITECDWSQDQTKIALKTNNINGYNASIFVIDMSGTVQSQILTNVSGAVGGLNFTVDNQNLLFTHDISGYQSSDYRQLNTHIFIYNFAAAISTDMSLYKEDGTNDLDPRYAPNEAKIIFVNTSNDGVSVKQVWMMDMDGDNRDLLFDNAYMPDWE